MLRGKVKIDPRTARIIRFASLVIPLILTIYTCIIQFSKIDSFHYPTSDIVVVSIMIPWVIAGFIQFLWPIKTQLGAWIYLAANHLFTMVTLIFISSFSTSLAPLWTVLFLTSYIYFSKRGLWFSIILLIITSLVDSAIHFNPGVFATNSVIAIGIVALGLTAVAIGRVQEMNTTRSQAQEALQRDRIITLVNNLADAILSTDREGIVRVYNAASLNLLDTNASLNGQAVDDVLKLKTKDGGTFKIHNELKKTKSVIIRDDLILPIEGEEMRIELTYSPIRNSNSFGVSKRSANQDGYILILRDVTKSKSLEEERDEFISVVSHELRTPITIAEGTISNVRLMMDRPEITDTILKEGIDTAHEQVLYLAKMVNDLSTLSRAERGVADAAEDITIRDLVDDLYKEYAPQAEAKKLHFNLDLGTHLGHAKASPLYLKELLQNFITNALKYTKEGTITLHVAREKDNLVFEVRDTGIGISKSDQGKIFNKFYRSEDYRTRETSGTGLGLYVAAKLAKKLGTKITFRSRLNHGSSFGFSLSMKEPKKS
jgi:signal transduction histidine kinase